jgi:MFS family permease
MADWWGRKFPIAVGCILMIFGGLLGAFANGYGSELKESSIIDTMINIYSVRRW